MRNAGNPGCSLAEFFNRGERVAGGPKPMWVYDAIRWNCQKFVSWCLKGSGLLTDSLSKFVNQKSEELVSGTLAQGFLGVATGIASRADSLLHGRS